MSGLLRTPALRYLLIGALLFAVKSAAEGPPKTVRLLDRSPVIVTSADLEDMRERHLNTVGSEPSRSAYDHMIAGFVDEELLYREAIALGMERGDSGTRYRLIEKMEYLDEIREGESEEQTVERAIALGLSRSDPMIRSSLIQKYRMLVRFSGFDPPDDERLRAHYERNRERYRRSSRVSLVHVFFSRQNRGDEDAISTAQTVLGTIRSENLNPSAAIALGDVFVHGHHVELQAPRTLAQMFGPDFGAQLMGAPDGEWIGPVHSSFGQHLVLVTKTIAAGYLPFESVRNQVRKAVEDKMRNDQIEQKLAELRDQYEVEVRWPKLDGARG